MRITLDEGERERYDNMEIIWRIEVFLMISKGRERERMRRERKEEEEMSSCDWRRDGA